MTQNIGKYLFVEEKNPARKRKTKIFELCSKSSNVGLGMIYYYPAWRRFVFAPDNEAMFDPRCLEDIVKFLNEQNKLHKLQLIQEKENRE